MNKISIAKQMINEILDHQVTPKHLSQVLIGGSLARQFYDQYSDIELIFVYDQADYTQICKIIKSNSNMHSELGQTTKDDILLDCLLYQSEKIDLIHITHQSLQNQLDQFNHLIKVDPSTQAIVACYQDPLILWQNKKIQLGHFRVQISDQHFLKIIEYGLKQFSTSMLSIHIARNDSIMIQQSLFSIQRAFLILVFAINKTIMPGYKQLQQSVSLLKTQPKDFLVQLETISQQRSLIVIDFIASLYKELIDLIEDQAIRGLLPNSLNFESLRTRNKY